MKSFENKIAVITGGADGMGAELARQLAAAGAHIAMCDISEVKMKESADQIWALHPDVRCTTHICDVADEASILAFRDEVLAQHETDHINLLFNNAGISGGGSLFEASREAWDRCFAVCWGGVYYGTRAFLPHLVAADEAHLVNTSSVNGFWASLGPDRPHTAYSAAKFAVKGFTEALITDLACNAPHVKVSVVMPGHIGTGIVENSLAHGVDEPDDALAPLLELAGAQFRENAPMTAASAAAVILEGVQLERWRILVGDDAHALDAAVRAAPDSAYDGDKLLELMRGVNGTAMFGAE